LDLDAGGEVKDNQLTSTTEQVAGLIGKFSTMYVGGEEPHGIILKGVNLEVLPWFCRALSGAGYTPESKI